MPNDIQTIDPLAAVAASGDTPRPSDIATAANVNTAAAPEVDVDGVPFDPVKHAVDWNGQPKKKTNGQWYRKTGNGALKAAGKPLPPQNGPKGPKAAATTPEPGKPATLPGGSTFVPPAPSAAAQATPGQTAAVDAVPVVAEPLTPDQCKATAQAITDGAIGMARMTRGEHWAASADERSQLIECLSRLWALYNLPRFGPIVELMLLVVSFILNGEKRREDIKKLWDWALGRKSIAVSETTGTVPQ